MNKKIVILGSVATVIAGIGAGIASKILKDKKVSDKIDEVFSFLEDTSLVDRLDDMPDRLTELNGLVKELSIVTSFNRAEEIFDRIKKIDREVFLKELYRDEPAIGEPTAITEGADPNDIHEELNEELLDGKNKGE